jgi:glycosyltransferase involved in cell wall biosynthesis
MDSDDWEGWGGWNDREPYPWLAKWFFARQEKWGMNHCHVLTVASRALETLAWGHGVAREKVVYLPNGPGIPLGHGAPRADEAPPTLLVYSRFFEFDVARLVAVIQQVYAALPALRVRVVGVSLEEADGARFASLLRQHGLLQLVTNVGWIDEAEIPAQIAAADVGIYLMDDTLLNRTKCPVKLADMAAMGLPVVAEAVGQVTEYVDHGKTGLLRESGDVAGIAADVVHLLTHREERLQLGGMARAHIALHFSWEQQARIVEKAYRGS